MGHSSVFHIRIINVYDPPTDFYVPVFYVLVTGKTQWTYWTVLKNEVLISTELKFSPGCIHCDFEIGLINAIKEQFTEIKVVGCYFHFKQALLKKMKEIGIPAEERSLAMKEGVLDVLTVIPHEEIETKGIAYVKSKIPKTNNKKWEQFWKYFKSTWLTRYNKEDWNINGVKNAQNRTNNALERFNRTLNNSFSTAHPNLLNFVETIRKESFEIVKKLNLIRLEKEKLPKHRHGIANKIPLAYSFEL